MKQIAFFTLIIGRIVKITVKKVITNLFNFEMTYFVSNENKF